MVKDSKSNNDIEYALKVLRNPGSLQARQRFRREIEAIQRVEHHSIIRVFDSSSEQDDFQYYVMEYHKDARTLANIISCKITNPFYSNVSLSLQLFEQLIEAIYACESSSQPIVHRDIKPQNILVLNASSIRLIDFGVCQIDDGAPITLTDENVGTLNYMAPECGAGNEDEITSQADIYSAAKVLWSAITSQQAFNRERQVFQKRSVNSMFPTEPNHWHLSHIFKKTVRESPLNRVRNAQEALNLIQEVRVLIQRGFPPLEEISQRCPSCGLKKIGKLEQAHNVFGSYFQRFASALDCSACGFIFLRNTDLLRENLEKIQNLN